MDVKPIKTEDDYDAALTEIDRLMGSPIDSVEGDRLEVFVTLVESVRGRALVDSSSGQG